MGLTGFYEVSPSGPDDGDRIQDAIGGSGGMPIFLTPGTFQVGCEISFLPGTTLLGVLGHTQIKCGSFAANSVFHGSGVSDVTVGGLTIDASAFSGESVFWWSNASRIGIRRVNLFSSASDQATKRGMYFEASTNAGTIQSEDITIEDCEFTGFRLHGIRLTANNSDAVIRRLRVVRSTFHNLGKWGGPGDQVGVGLMPNGVTGGNLSGNTFVGVGRPDSLEDHGLYASNSRFLVIHGNYFRECASGINIRGDLQDGWNELLGEDTGPDGIVVTGNVVDGVPDRHDGIIVESGYRCTVVANYLRRASLRAAGVQDSIFEANVVDMEGLSDATGIICGSGGNTSQRVVFAHNRIFGIGPRGAGMAVSAGQDILIEGNSIGASTDEAEGIRVRPESGLLAVERIAVVNNRISLGMSGTHIAIQGVSSTSATAPEERNGPRGGWPGQGPGVPPEPFGEPLLNGYVRDFEIEGNRLDSPDGSRATPLTVQGRAFGGWIHHNRGTVRGYHWLRGWEKDIQPAIRVDWPTSDILVEDNIADGDIGHSLSDVGRRVIARRNKRMRNPLVLPLTSIDQHHRIFSVEGGDLWITTNKSPTRLEQLVGGYLGQTIQIFAGDMNTTIGHGITLRLHRSRDFKMNLWSTLQLTMFSDHVWYEVGRRESVFPHPIP